MAYKHGKRGQGGRGPAGFSYMILIKYRMTYFSVLFFRCLPSGNFFADALAFNLIQNDSFWYQEF